MTLLVLIVLIVSLAGVVAFYFYPHYAHKWVSFSPGDTLYSLKTGETLGTVSARSRSHEFTPKVTADAYLVTMKGSGEPEMWIPAIDLHRTFRKIN